MTITVTLPDDITQHENARREALEALAIAGYRSEELTSRQACELLGMGRIEFEGFLKQRGVMDHAYSMEQLLNDIEVGDRYMADRLASR